MHRRDFMKGLIGSGALGAVPLAFAGVPAAGSDEAGRIVVVGQADLPQAAALADRIAGSVETAGFSAARVTARGDVLGSYAGVAAILDRAARARLIGVMDDAAALVFQQIAAARGAGWVMQAHHRIAGGEVRHCCNVAGMEAGQAWVDAPQRYAERIARLYAEALGGRALAAPREPAAGAPAAFAAGPASFVSFAINT